MAKFGSLLVLLLGMLISFGGFANTMSIDEHTSTPLNLTPWLMVTHSNANPQLDDIQALPKSPWHKFTSDDIQRLSQHDFWLRVNLRVVMRVLHAFSPSIIRYWIE